MFARLKKLAPAVGLFVGFIAIPVAALAQATLLPNAVQNYTKDDGTPVSGGSIEYYVPNTTTPKATWKDSGKTQLNPNPLPLDAAGRPDSNGAGTYGDGIYRQILKDADDNVIWDAVTSSTGGGGSGGGGTIPVGDGIKVGTILPTAALTPPTNYLFTYGQAVSRTTYSDLMAAITISLAITCSSGSPTVSGLPDTQQVPLGSPVEVACFAPGTTVLSKTVNSITFNSNATVSTSATAVIFPFGNGNGSTTFNLPEGRGNTIVGRSNMGGTASSNLTSTYYGTGPDALGAVGGSQSSALTTNNIPPLTFAGTAAQAISVNTVDNNILSGSLTTINAQGGGAVPYQVLVGASGNSGTRTSNGTFTATGTVNAASTSTPVSRVQPSTTLNYIIKAQNDASAFGITTIIGTAPINAVTSVTTTTISLANSGVTASSYGSQTSIPVITVDQWGRITSASGVAPTPEMSNVLNLAPFINGLTANVAINGANDYLIVRRGSDGAIMKVNPNNIASAAVAGVASLGGLTGALLINSTLAFTGSTLGVVTTALSTFTSGAAGIVPASGGGTTNYLRADGTWAAPLSSQWSNNANGIHYNSGNVGIGNILPVQKLAVTGTYSLNANFTVGTNITAALNTALASYYDIQLPCGTFQISSAITFALSTQRLRGCGRNSTVLQVTAGMAGFVVNVPTGVYGTIMEDLAIDINSQAVTQGCAGAVGAVRTQWNRIACYNFPSGTAGAFQFSSTSNTLATGSTGSSIRDCWVYQMPSLNPAYNGHMVEISYSSQVTVTGCHSQFIDNGVNISASDNVVVSNNVFSGLYTSAQSTFAGVRCSNSSTQATITGNTILYTPRGIILHGCQNATVTGNSIKNTLYHAIYITADSAFGANGTPTQGNIVSNNAIQDTCLLNTCSAAILFDKGAAPGDSNTNNLVSANNYLTIGTPPAVTMIQLSGGVAGGANSCPNNFANVTIGGC